MFCIIKTLLSEKHSMFCICAHFYIIWKNLFTMNLLKFMFTFAGLFISYLVAQACLCWFQIYFIDIKPTITMGFTFLNSHLIKLILKLSHSRHIFHLYLSIVSIYHCIFHAPSSSLLSLKLFEGIILYLYVTRFWNSSFSLSSSPSFFHPSLSHYISLSFPHYVSFSPNFIPCGTRINSGGDYTEQVMKKHFENIK